MGNKQSTPEKETDGTPLQVDQIEIKEEDLSPRQREALRRRMAETEGNTTPKDLLDIVTDENPKSEPIQIGIVGDAGAGKSTFINSYRGLSTGDKGAARVSAASHMTAEATQYDVPGKGIIVVDFPGVIFMPKEEDGSGAQGPENTFNVNSYLIHNGEEMQKCDFFLIFLTNRLSNNVVWIAKEVRKMGKRLLFVRSKADEDMKREKEDNPKQFPTSINRRITEKRMIDRFRKSAKEALQQLDYGIVDEEDIFVICGLKKQVARGDYDMGRLHSAMLLSLSGYKQGSLISNITDFSMETISQKADVLRKGVWAMASANAAFSAVPIPGLGVALDIATLIASYKILRRSFNINDASIAQLADISNKPVLTLMQFRNQNMTLWNHMQHIGGPMAIRQLVALAANSVTIAGLAVASTTVNIALPIVGAILAAPASFAVIVFVLRKFIEELEACATKLFKFAFGEDKGSTYIGMLGEGNSDEMTVIKSICNLPQDDDEEQHKTTTETSYHKLSGNVTLVELPPPQVKQKGLGKKVFDEEAYMKSFAVDMSACGVLLVLIGASISEDLAAITKRAKEMEIDVLFIRVMDCLEEGETGSASSVMDELERVGSIRKKVHDDLKAHMDDTALSDVFIINGQHDNVVQDKWDIASLRAAILRAVSKFDTEVSDLIQGQEDGTLMLKEDNNCGPSDDVLNTLNASSKTNKPRLPDWKTTTISIAIIGGSKADIGAFIHSLKARTTGNLNPDHMKRIVTTWRLPGASFNAGRQGTLHISQYMLIHGDKIQDCDLLLVFCQDRVTKEAAWVANKALEMKKMVLLIGCEQTATLGATADPPAENTEGRDFCNRLTEELKEHLRTAGSDAHDRVDANHTFIASGLPDKFIMGNLEMFRLKEAILSQLNDLQQQAFVSCFPDMSPEFLHVKTRVLKKLAWVQAVDAMDVSQGPGLLLDTPVKIEIVRETCELLLKYFGIDKESVDKLAETLATEKEALQELVQSKLPTCTKLLSEDADPAPPNNIRTLASLLSENSSTLLTLGLANWAFSTTVSITGFGGKALNVVAYFLCKMIDEQAECARELHKYLASANNTD